MHSTWKRRLGVRVKAILEKALLAEVLRGQIKKHATLCLHALVSKRPFSQGDAMIVICPNCNSKSRVDTAIASGSTRVRCSHCQQVFIPSLVPDTQAPVDVEKTAALIDLQAVASSTPDASKPSLTSLADRTDLVGRQDWGQLNPHGAKAHLLTGFGLLFLFTGFIFYAQGNAIYASLGLLGGRSIVLPPTEVKTALVIEQLVSTTYTLANGHQALVALGTVHNTSAEAAEKMEVDFAVTQAGASAQHVRAPLGAVLSLEELATVPTQGDPVEELRQRAQQVPPLAGHAGGQKFMAIVMDPPADLDTAEQSAVLTTPLAPAAPTAPVAVPASALPSPPQNTQAPEHLDVKPQKTPATHKASARWPRGHKTGKKHRDSVH